jgi:diguanylate cyclase (GGDEF)-like protein/PAS domain S-box-containing protein
VPDSVINLLMACSIENSAVIQQALGHHAPRMRIHHIDSAKDLQQALDFPGWHLAFSELEPADFSAFDLVSLLDEKEMDVPVLVFEGSGAEEVAMRCLESGMCRFIRSTPPYLNSLPRLVDDLLSRGRKDQDRRRLEKQLIESEELFLDVFDHTSDLIQRVAPDGSITYTNRAWRNALGYSEDEARSLNLLDILHPDSMLCCQDRFSRLLNGETLSCIDFKFIAKSGETVYLSGDCGSVIKEGGVISTRGIFKNLTETVRAEEALKVTEARYQVLYENAPDIYTTISPTGEILSINRNGAAMLGYEVEELIGESAAKVIHPEDQRKVFACANSLFRDPEAPADLEYRVVRKDGSIFWVHQRATLEPGLNVQRLLTVCRDITDKRVLEDQLAYQATHDMLTSLLNRREFERRLHQLLSTEAEPADKHVLCFLDLDQFKAINDNCGHIAGDELLRQIAALLKGQVRARDTLARIGGDEFAVLMEHVSLDKAIEIAERIRTTIEAFEFHWRAQRLSVGVSIGIVPIQAGRSITDTLNLADMACYTAKKAGRNRVYTRHADAVHTDLFGNP